MSSSSFISSLSRSLKSSKKFEEMPILVPRRRQTDEEKALGKRPMENEEGEDESPELSENEAESPEEEEGDASDENMGVDETDEEANESMEEDAAAAEFPVVRNNIAELMALGYTWEDAIEADEKLQASKREEEKLKQNKPKAALKALKAMSFIGTCYPHKETMNALGIRRDVEILLGSCGLSKFMTMDAPAYQTESLHFLASVQIHYYAQNVESLMQKEGGGYITFSVRKENYRMTLKEVQNVFGFFDGTNNVPTVAKEEMERVWQMIAGPRPFSSSRSKSSRIRNPAISYMRRAIANTFFARCVTGTISLGEMQMLVTAIKDAIGDRDDGTALIGDSENGGLTVPLLAHLSDYRDWATTLCKKGSSGTLCVGGIITPILEACGVEIRSKTRVEPRYMDLEYLKRIDFLAHDMVNGRYVYMFHHPAREIARLLLPCRELTSIRMGNNINFSPPLELLYDPDAPQPPSPTGDDSSDPEKYLYEEFNTSKPGGGMKAVHKNIGFLRKANKWLIKKVKGLVKSNEKMEQRLHVLEGRDAGPSSVQRSHEREEPPRRHSVSLERPQPTPPTRPRHSSAGFSETLQYRRRIRKPVTCSSKPLDQPMVEAAEASRRTTDSSAPLDQAVLERPQPTYTLDSMNASTAHFFDF